jgi:hypothetical protein
LRCTNLLAERDPNSPDTLDAHPLIRQFFREQLQDEFPEAWRTGNECLFHHFQAIAERQPEGLAEMELLFQAVAFGCQAGLHRQALREVYLPRILRGRQFYAADVLGARGALLSVLSHFFEDRSWECLLEPSTDREALEPRDQLMVLQHAGALLTATMGYSNQGALRCYQQMKLLCERLGDAESLSSALVSNWMHSVVCEPLKVALRRAEEILVVAQHHAAS